MEVRLGGTPYPCPQSARRTSWPGLNPGMPFFKQATLVGEGMVPQNPAPDQSFPRFPTFLTMKECQAALINHSKIEEDPDLLRGNSTYETCSA